METNLKGGKTMPETEYHGLDRFEKARERIWNLPGFVRRQSTITADGTELFPSETWVIQSIMTDDQAAVFLESVSSEGGNRLVLPTKVVRTIYRHYDEIMKARKKLRAQRAADTRKRKEQGDQEPDEVQPGNEV
jgi:hypothetical protein